MCLLVYNYFSLSSPLWGWMGTPNTFLWGLFLHMLQFLHLWGIFKPYAEHTWKSLLYDTNTLPIKGRFLKGTSRSGGFCYLLLNFGIQILNIAPKMIKKKSLKELNGVNKCKSLFYLDSLSSAEFYKMSDSPQFRKSASYILKSPFKTRQHQWIVKIREEFWSQGLKYKIWKSQKKCPWVFISFELQFALFVPLQ